MSEELYQEMLDALKYFVVRVEEGSILSRKTYAKYKELIERVEGEFCPYCGGSGDYFTIGNDRKAVKIRCPKCNEREEKK